MSYRIISIKEKKKKKNTKKLHQPKGEVNIKIYLPKVEMQ